MLSLLLSVILPLGDTGSSTTTPSDNGFDVIKNVHPDTSTIPQDAKTFFVRLLNDLLGILLFVTPFLIVFFLIMWGVNGMRDNSVKAEEYKRRTRYGLIVMGIVVLFSIWTGFLANFIHQISS